MGNDQVNTLGSLVEQALSDLDSVGTLLASQQLPSSLKLPPQCLPRLGDLVQATKTLIPVGEDTIGCAQELARCTARVTAALIHTETDVRTCLALAYYGTGLVPLAAAGLTLAPSSPSPTTVELQQQRQAGVVAEEEPLQQQQQQKQDEEEARLALAVCALSRLLVGLVQQQQ